MHLEEKAERGHGTIHYCKVWGLAGLRTPHTQQPHPCRNCLSTSSSQMSGLRVLSYTCDPAVQTYAQHQILWSRCLTLGIDVGLSISLAISLMLFTYLGLQVRGLHSATNVRHSIYITGLNCLRIWAICQKRWSSTIIVFLLSIFTPCSNIVRRISFLGKNAVHQKSYSHDSTVIPDHRPSLQFILNRSEDAGVSLWYPTMLSMSFTFIMVLRSLIRSLLVVSFQSL